MPLRPCLILLASLACLLAAAPAQAREDRPNVVVIMTDDQTVRDMRSMPRTRQLLGADGAGATFSNSFVDFSLCCPSRASFFSGQYSFNHGVLGLYPPDGGYTAFDNTNYLATWLQQAGYRTMHLGKFLNGYGTQNPDPHEVPPGWDDWEGTIDPTTYNFNDFTINQNGALVRHKGVYQTDYFTERGSELIQKASGGGRPFFLSLAYVAPHHGGPIEPDDPASGVKTPAVALRHRDAFSGRPMPFPPNFNEADVSDKPWNIRRRVPLWPERVGEIQELWQQRQESLLAVDEGVAKIVDTLRSTGELDNTLIMFTSDNGFLTGEHRVPSGKVLVYEPSIRVPLLMRGPGVPAGARRRQLVNNVDLSPTILDAAGAKAGKPQDGRSLFPLLKDPGLDWGRDMFVMGRGSGVNFTAVRSSRYVYVRYANGNRELYDIKRDPFQLGNLARSRSHAGIRKDMFRRLRRLRTCRGRRCSLGPRLAVRVQPRRGCVNASVGVRLVGKDRKLVKRAAFYVRKVRMTRASGKRVLRRRVVRTGRLRPGRRFQVRVRATMNDGRLVTLDRVRRACRTL